MLAAIRVTSELPSGIHRLAEVGHAEGFDFVGRLVREWNTGENRFSAPGEVFLCCYLDDALVGFGGLNRDPYTRIPSDGRIRHVYLAPEARGLGLGGLLVRELVQRAYSSFTRLRLSTQQAAPFYEHLGFARVTEHKATHVRRLAAPAA